MILTARMIGAEDALACGLVNQVVALEDLLPAAEKMARSMMKKFTESTSNSHPGRSCWLRRWH